MNDSAASHLEDIDPVETREWLEALEAVLEIDGSERAHYLLQQLVARARQEGAFLPFSANTAYLNTIPAHLQPQYPGNSELEWHIRSYIRWNAMAMVVRANRNGADLGGHIATFASAATLYDVGFNHFWRAPDNKHGGDLIYMQGHSSPGIYARAFLEGRLHENDLDNFRREASARGLSSYPHPWLMPDFWQFPTVSMGLGPIQAIYRARFLKYLHARGLADTANRKVWCFVGDGETGEPETLGALSLASREKLDNLIFVVNCNLQRLDGPVRGNGKIIQELESDFRGSGWHVLKVIWGSYWDPLLARDKDGHLRDVMESTVDGEYQNYKAKGGAYTREHFFAKHPDVKAMVAHLSNRDIWRLNRGGHDPLKVHAAYHEAVQTEGQPTVILAKTVKGYGMGTQGEGMNVAHQQKKLDIEHLQHFSKRLGITLTDEQVETAAYVRPAEDSDEMQYMQERRKALGGSLPVRRGLIQVPALPEAESWQKFIAGAGEREISTTMAFVRSLTALCKDKEFGDRIVPIVPDEARTFGMDGMFREFGIYSAVGQLYEPQDKDQVLYYREDAAGQILEEGICEAGAMSSWIAAGTSYSNDQVQTIPFYIFYSMFGFQRIGDLAYAAGDQRARGFLIGATSGRTSLAGEGLQHNDGHSHVLASTIPNCISYDPAYAYEIEVLVREGLRRMVTEQEDVFFYLTVTNEKYLQPAMPEAAWPGIVRGMYALPDAHKDDNIDVRLLGSGALLPETRKAAILLEAEFGLRVRVYSVTSYTELARDGMACERATWLGTQGKPKETPWVQQVLSDSNAPVVAVTDYMRAWPEQIRSWVPAPYATLGTDGYGRSDSRSALREFFEVSARHIALRAIHLLAANGLLDDNVLQEARTSFSLEAGDTPPWQR